MIRAEKHMPVNFDLFITAFDEADANNSHIDSYKNIISDLGLEEGRCSSIQFQHPKFLSEQVLSALEGHGQDDLVCFLTTDEMLVSGVDERLIEEEFKEKMLFSFSLRLGKNITKNSMVNMKNKVLPIADNGTTMRWDWDKHYVDFSGPLSVHGHYFRTKEIYRMLKKIGTYTSYDELEDKLQEFMNFPKKLMASFVESKAVSIDPLFHGNDRAFILQLANKRLMNNDPIPIVVDGPQEELHFNPFKEILSQMHQWKKQHILFKFPARGRKEKLFSTLDAYHQRMVNKENFQFLISIDEDDEILNDGSTIAAIEAHKNTKVVVGPSKGKINAVNRDMEQAEPWDIVVLVSDDMMPKLTGFDMIIRKDMSVHFPEGDGVLWYNDGHQQDKLNTLCILDKKYYDRFGYIYYGGYKSLYSDNEFMEVSKRLGRVKYNSLCIIEHQHWAWGYGEMDDLYTRNEQYIGDDGDTFQKRAAIGFELPIVA